VSRVRELGVVQVQEDHKKVYYAQEPAILADIMVKEGQKVRSGTILAEFRSVKLDLEEAEVTTELNIRKEMLDELRRSYSQGGDKEKAEVTRQIVTTEAELQEARDKVAQIQRAKAKMVLRADRDGVVMGLPRRDEIGKMWDKEQATPFCTIGDPTRLQVLLPVVPSDYDLVRDNLVKAKTRKEELPVVIRVHGHDAETWEGRVRLDKLPSSEAKEVPEALSNKAGGPLAIKPSADPKALVPQNQVYLIPVEFVKPDSTICTGSLAQVKIHCEYRSLAWWTWRTICSTFDIGLL
jgi:putative peptide zinc metalloprotease protein